MAGIDALLEVLKHGHSTSWRGAAETALEASVKDLYQRGLARPQTGAEFDEEFVGEASGGPLAIRAPEMKGTGANVPFAALLHQANPTSGAYGGDSFVLFPALDGQNSTLIGLGVGTNGLAPDESILTSPGHARLVSALARWLNQQGKGLVAWSKADPSRTDIDLPEAAIELMEGWWQAANRYGEWMYFIFKPTGDINFDRRATMAILDVFCDARRLALKASCKKEIEIIRAEIQGAAFSRHSAKDVSKLIINRRFVVLTGPPGTGKTHMAREVLEKHFDGIGKVYQLHAGYTVETFVGGLSPVPNKEGRLSFKPTPGLLMQACSEARKQPKKPFLLVLDEINRTDLAKVLGEALFLFETGEPDRVVSLPLDFEGFEDGLGLPSNLYVLGTMNSADRSIALIDLAVRRRFAFVPLWPDGSVLNDQIAARGESDPAAKLAKAAFDKLQKLFVDHATDEGLDLMPGHSYFIVPQVAKEDEALVSFKDKLRFELDPLIQDYLQQGLALGLSEELRAYRQWLASEL